MVEQTENGQEVMLVFRDCMIRQTLFKFGHHQKGSLCNLMTGFFASALQTMLGHESRLEIIHAGENACIKKLILQTKPIAVQNGEIQVADSQAGVAAHG
jgi:hypothetical protein